MRVNYRMGRPEDRASRRVCVGPTSDDAQALARDAQAASWHRPSLVFQTVPGGTVLGYRARMPRSRVVVTLLVHGLLAVALIGGCSKKRDRGACKPMSVTAGGVAIGALGHGLARLNKTGHTQSWQVDVWNHDKVTCEKYNNKRGRNVEPGEVSVRAFAGGEGMMGQGVGIDVHTQGGVEVEVVGAEPKAIGDQVTLCVDHAAFKPIAGTYKDQDVVIDGLFEGTYCGELSF